MLFPDGVLSFCETWVITKPTLRALEGFHHRVARGLARLPIRYLADEERWEYPATEAVLEKADLFPIEQYLNRRRQYILRYATTNPLIDECSALCASAVIGRSHLSPNFWGHIF